MESKTIASKLDELTNFQKEQLYREIINYIEYNHFVNDQTYRICPVCGHKDPSIIKRGFLNGKQRYQCKHCMKRFVSTKGKLNYNSQQSQASWSMVITDTLNAVPLLYTAAQLDCAVDTVFHMRHKFLILLEQLIEEQGSIMDGIVEIDETYVPDSYKGIKDIQGRKARKHGESAVKRGLSNEMMCVQMGSNRNGKEVALCINRAKPSSDEVICVFHPLIKDKTMLINDGLFSNYELIKLRHLTSMVVGHHKEYTEVVHLNTVNNMHSGFKELYRSYRGVASKYLNRYLALYIFIRKYMGMDNQEKLMAFIRCTKNFFTVITNHDVKTQNLLMI